MIHKDQHWVPQSYLKAWIDPNTPTNHDGYVWVFNKTGDKHKKKAPKNLFSEPDFYTKKNDDGSRDLTIEKKLSQIEADFIAVRRNKLDSKQILTSEDLAKIIVFVSVMSNRTKLQRDKEENRWEHVLKVMDDMAKCIKTNPTAPIPQLRSSTPENSMSHEEVRKFAREPIQSTLPITSRVTADIIVQMNMHIICTTNDPGFITSDNPCVMFDPVYSSQYLALGCPSIEITFPISPKQLAIFFWSVPRKPPEYAYAVIKENITDEVDEFNRRTRFFCDEYFVANQNIIKDFWFK